MNAEMVEQLAAHLEAAQDHVEALAPGSPEFEAARREIAAIEVAIVELEQATGTPPEDLAYVPEELLGPAADEPDDGA